MKPGNIGFAALPATCGELVQGTLDGVGCLVSCPIDRYSFCHIELKHGTGWEVPSDAPKSVAALRIGLDHLHCTEWGGQFRLSSSIPRGRGYGSSTADIGATLNALGHALERSVSARKTAKWAVCVEPSDSTLFPGLALFAHRDAEFHKLLGSAPPLMVLVLDPGGQVDTLAFNQIEHGDQLKRLAPQHREAFDLLQQGHASRDWHAVGRAASMSAAAHQTILHSPLVDLALPLARDIGALGLCRAHSGTIVGLLLDPGEMDVKALEAHVARRLPTRVTVSLQSMVDGGPRIGKEIHGPRSSVRALDRPTF